MVGAGVGLGVGAAVGGAIVGLAVVGAGLGCDVALPAGVLPPDGRAEADRAALVW